MGGFSTFDLIFNQFGNDLSCSTAYHYVCYIVSVRTLEVDQDDLCTCVLC